MKVAVFRTKEVEVFQVTSTNVVCFKFEDGSEVSIFVDFDKVDSFIEMLEGAVSELRNLGTPDELTEELWNE